MQVGSKYPCILSMAWIVYKDDHKTRPFDCVYSGKERYPLSSEIEVISLKGLMEFLSSLN